MTAGRHKYTLKGVAVDSAGNLLITEGNYAGVCKVSADGTISQVLISDSYRQSLWTARSDLFVAGSQCDSDVTCYNAVRKSPHPAR
jgi:hypothetical protein